ncbi:MAG: putative salt-induced outer membrane protein, partial [Paraglaciecola sp.]
MKKSFIVFGLLAATNVCAEDKVKPFKMDGEFGLIATSGNTDTTSVKGKLSAHHEIEKWSNDFIFEALYKKDEVTLESGETASQTTAQKFFLSGQGNYKLENPNHRLFAFGSYEDDKFSSYDYQSTVAAGWSQKVWEDDTSKFEYSVGPGYTFAKRADGTSENGVIVRGALDYQWKISDTATFKQLLSTEVGENNTKSKSETSVSAQINGSLSLKLSLTMDHNSDVLEGTENLDTQVAATVVY